LFKNIPSIELSKLEEALFKTDPNAKIVRDIQTNIQTNRQQLERTNRHLMPGIFGSLYPPHQPPPANLQPTVTQPMGTNLRTSNLLLDH
jgi:hypothetical protein